MASHQKEGEKFREILGVMPAAGWATRLMPLPFSKELFPIGLHKDKESGKSRLKVVCEDLLEKFHLAGIKKAYVILREGKWDIPTFLSDGSIVDIDIAYLMVGVSYGVPFTLDQAYPFIQGTNVAFGFPDITFQPHDAFEQLLDRLSKTKANIVLGLFPANHPEMVDMVEVGPEGRIKRIFVKQDTTNLTHAWLIAIWTQVFTDFLHEFVTRGKDMIRKLQLDLKDHRNREVFMGDVIQAGIEEGLFVDSVIFNKGTFLDIGTLGGLENVLPMSFDE